MFLIFINSVLNFIKKINKENSANAAVIIINGNNIEVKFIPWDAMGFVIGPQGKNIKGVRADSGGAMIDMPKELIAKIEPGKQPVYFHSAYEPEMNRKNNNYNHPKKAGGKKARVLAAQQKRYDKFVLEGKTRVFSYIFLLIFLS